MERPWFDPETGLLLLDEYVAERPSFQHILADGVVTDGELAEQAQRVSGLLRELEQTLDPAARELATEVLCELAVLHGLQMRHRQG